MTNKLYYDSSYLTEWETSCLKMIERENDYFVILEETAFYPHGGGQPCDIGMINGISVLDVVIENDEVLHKLERLPEQPNVICSIDWERRFDHMQQHSGQHLLSATCLDVLNARTVSFHLGQEYSTIDIELSELNQEQLSKVEIEVNKRVFQNKKITSYFVTTEEVQSLPLVKMPKVTENIRIVEIEGIEYNACSGTHVSQTSEIGMIKLLKAEKQKGIVRIYFLCGYRVLEDYNKTLQMINTLSMKYNTSRDNIIDRIEKAEQEQKILEKQVLELSGKLEQYESKELLANRHGAFLAHIFEDKSMKEIQRLASTILKENDLLLLFGSTVENKLVLMHSGTYSLSCGKLFKEHLLSFNGKGGGNDKAAQAGFSASEDLLRFFEWICEEVKEGKEM